ncbi:MAG: outer membrane beta-barrel protein [Desulfuromusa sp.]|nr:outer membrane beta-barrel protein [Desulfuromusa sp.]
MMKSICCFLFVFIFLSGISAVQAADYEVTPIFGYTFGGDFEDADSGQTLNLDEDKNFGVIIGLRDKSKAHAFYEFLYSYQSTSLKGNDIAFTGESRFDVDINYFHLGGRYGEAWKGVIPYVAAGIGVTHFSPEQGDSETKFSFSIGGGIMAPITEHISLRFEGRGFGTAFDGSSEIFCVNNQCAVRVEGDVLWQFSAFAGVVFTF